nr:DUF624 domain-containing protein [Oscillospiraceae bacterium]
MKDKKRENGPAAWRQWTFLRVLREYWVDLILLNLIFLLFCLPVVSVPAALMSMCSLIFRMQQEEPVRVFRDFCREFRRLMPKSGFPGLCLVLGLGLCGMGAYSVFFDGGPREMLLPAVISVYILVYLVFSVCLYVFPMAAILEMPASRILRNGLILSIAHPGRAVGALTVILCLNFLLLITTPYTLPAFVIIHFSLCGLTGMCFAEEGIRRCIL